MTDLPVLTISQITQAIRLSLETTFPSICLQGEVSNFKKQSSGHLYFSLKDANAQIGAVMFRGDADALKTLPKDGDQVIVKGALNVYAPRGNYQVVIRELTLAGLGELLLKLEQLKIKLKKKGYFERVHKKPLPKFPKTIGIVTSPTGAVIQDILNILTRRHAGFHVILNPVKVQGDGAAAEIARAIDQFNQYELVDVIIVGRGGGSIEDLWAFNEEVVADAIFRSAIPIVAAVGHETDHCIAEYVADVRAPTPSAAAEMVMAEGLQITTHLTQLRTRLQQTMTHLITHDRHRLNGLMRHPLLASPYALLGPWIQRLDDLRTSLDQSMQWKVQHSKQALHGWMRQVCTLKPTTQIAHTRQKLQQWQKSLDNAIQNQVSAKRNRLNADALLKRLDQLWLHQQHKRRERFEGIAYNLSSIDPKNLLKKGYTILFAEKGDSVITSVRALRPQQRIRMLLADGEAAATVTELISRE